METPICPRTIGPDRPYLCGSGLEPRWERWIPKPRPCLGSRCALWVPEVMSEDGPVPADVAPGCNCIYGGPDATPTGRGWCVDNLRRPPWPDPAGKE